MIEGFALVWEDAGDDPHAAGQRAATTALSRFGATLAYEGPRPIACPVIGVGPLFPGVAISIAHAGSHAVAIAGPAAALGIDLVPDAELERIEKLAPRYLAREASLATTPRDLAACFAAKEAALKALGLGLLDGGMFDTCAVTVTSLEPPRLSPQELTLVIARCGDATVAVAYR